MSATLQRRLDWLENEVGERDKPVMVAIRTLDGSISWNGRLFHDREEFHAALDAANLKPDGEPPLIVISMYRERRAEREWQETRYISKEQRKELTDTIRDILLPHARSQGSTAPEAKLCLSYSKMIKSILFADADRLPVDYRDRLSIRQLSILTVAESIAGGVIQGEVAKGTPYKGKDGIFEKAKAKIVQYAATVGVLQLGGPERLAIGRALPAVEHAA